MTRATIIEDMTRKVEVYQKHADNVEFDTVNRNYGQAQVNYYRFMLVLANRMPHDLELFHTFTKFEDFAKVCMVFPTFRQIVRDLQIATNDRLMNF